MKYLILIGALKIYVWQLLFICGIQIQYKKKQQLCKHLFVITHFQMNMVNHEIKSDLL